MNDIDYRLQLLVSTAAQTMHAMTVLQRAARRSQRLQNDLIRFAELYCNGDDTLRGNGTQCVLAIRPQLKYLTAANLGSDWLKTFEVQQFISSNRKQIQQDSGINPQWVLNESVRVYRMAVGDEAAPESITVNGETVTVHRKAFNANAASKALEMIGKNINVNAFQDNVTLSDGSALVELLQARQKALENKSARVIDAEVTIIDDDQSD